MGHATAGALDAVCSVPWMDPTLSSADFSNKLLNGQLDENKWQRVVNHDRIEDIRNFANTPGKNLFNPVLLYVDKNKINEIKPLNGTGVISVPFDFLKERKGEFHDYFPSRTKQICVLYGSSMANTAFVVSVPVREVVIFQFHSYYW